MRTRQAARGTRTHRQPSLPRLRRADRRTLLLGTALASTLIAWSLPTTALAQVICTYRPDGITELAVPDPIICPVNRNIFNPNGSGIELSTVGANHNIGLFLNANVTSRLTLGDSFAVDLLTIDDNSAIDVVNTGDLKATSRDGNATALSARTTGQNSDIKVRNEGDLTTQALLLGVALTFYTDDGESIINIENVGKLDVTSKQDARGISAQTNGDNSPISIVNEADVNVNGKDGAVGFLSETFGDGSSIDFANFGGSATVTSTEGNATGIALRTFGPSSGIYGFVDNSGRPLSMIAQQIGTALEARTAGDHSPISIVNEADVDVKAKVAAIGFLGQTDGDNSSIDFVNFGTVNVEGNEDAIAIQAQTFGSGSPIRITNLSRVISNHTGIATFSNTGTTIVNGPPGEISAPLAIDSKGAATIVINSGRIDGRIDLSDEDDRLENLYGGIFYTELTSNFGYGDDLFVNERGGTVFVTPKTHEVVLALVNQIPLDRFEGLERFKNKGLISMQDGVAGGSFGIFNTPDDTNLDFIASGQSTLAVDSFLGPPGSISDIFIIGGNVSGQTQVAVNNTNPGPGVFNPEGIPVVFVNGSVGSDAFSLDAPIDTGFFDWDIYFTKTGSGFFELRSYPGAGAHLLPELITAAQDIFHATNETWFDRTADLRVLLNRAAPLGLDPDGKLGAGDGAPSSFVPAVWVKGGGTWLEQEDNASTTAYGRTYRYNLNRDLDVMNFETGIDLGKPDLLAPGDMLVFGMLGGAVFASLDYDNIARQFDYEGGEVGAYATYLNGGLFIDTLAKVDILDLEPQDVLGFPNSLDTTVFGIRTDAGYRFGSFRRGPFIEPLATLAIAWADVDGFSLGGNTVSFDDEADVRGRLGLRVGTSHEVWAGTLMEPFVIGSVWGHLSGDNTATLTSIGTTFRFEDEPDDVWGVVSTGVNFFNPGAQTAVFAKLDVTFGEETEGIAAKGGMRFNW
ncbi:MAG: autotransporter outer membrane beta-barrel domain-containing protein [Methyloceanibacter sp.]|uniref:autotransporter outer membrane beta-barrel domain-containing protein n=1 Tax=Methyloceanibacter sp. TaxID=1965321 RepID=UPI003D6CBB4F